MDIKSNEGTSISFNERSAESKESIKKERHRKAQKKYMEKKKKETEMILRNDTSPEYEELI